MQWSELYCDEQTKERELRPLLQIKDNYEKVILTMDKSLYSSIDGIKVINIINWLLV